MKKYAPLLLLLLAFRCQHDPDPSPENPLKMELRVDYQPDRLTLNIRGTVFRSHVGPTDAPFDRTELYLAEGQPAGYALLATTAEKQFALTGLRPGATYYLTARGVRGTYTSELSTPIRVIADVLKPASAWQPFDRTSWYTVSPDGRRAVRQHFAERATWLEDWSTGRRQSLAYANTEQGILLPKSWDATGERVFFEISRNKNRALVAYDVAKATFTELPLPANARLWSYAIAPDGKKLAFTDYGRPGVWLYEFGSGDPKKLPIEGFTEWTADSRHLLLAHFTASGGVNLRLFDPKTEVSTPFETEPTGGGTPMKASPSGRYLLFNGALSGCCTLWLRDFQQNTLRPVQSAVQFGWLGSDEFYVVPNAPETPTGTPQILKYRVP